VNRDEKVGEKALSAHRFIPQKAASFEINTSSNKSIHVASGAISLHQKWDPSTAAVSG
jgi:hypothetical protein